MNEADARLVAQVLAQVVGRLRPTQLARLADKLHNLLHAPTIYPGSYAAARAHLLDVLRECL